MQSVFPITNGKTDRVGCGNNLSVVTALISNYVISVIIIRLLKVGNSGSSNIFPFTKTKVLPISFRRVLLNFILLVSVI